MVWVDSPPWLGDLDVHGSATKEEHDTDSVADLEEVEPLFTNPRKGSDDNHDE